jgi:alpha-ribazole phosphatase CobZ
MLKHYLSGNNLIIELESDYQALSTAAYHKTYDVIKYVVFNEVTKYLRLDEVEQYCTELIRTLGLDLSKTSVFLTAADVSKYTHTVKEVDTVRVEVFMTLGIDWVSCLDSVVNIYGVKGQLNTINIAVFVSKPLNNVGLLDVFRLVSEVKGSLMTLLGPTCTTTPSVGTPSDATLVASPLGSERYLDVSVGLGRAVISALIEAIVGRLKELSLDEYIRYALGGISIEELHKISMEVYSKCEIPDKEFSKVSSEVLNELLTTLKDPNILALLRGSRFIEFILALGMVHGLSVDDYLKDSPGIIIDELIGKALAEYVNGFKGLLSYYWVERLKKGGEVKELLRLPPITDDLITSLVGAVLSRVYDRYSRV